MPAKALVMAAVSAGVQIIGAVEQAKGAVKQAEFEAQQIQLQKDASELEALQAEKNERTELMIALGTQSAQAAAQGIGVGGGSIQAIQRDTRLKSTQNIRNIKLMSQLKSRQFSLGIEQTRKAGESAATGAIFSALSNIAGQGMDLASSGVFSSTPKSTTVPIPGRKPTRVPLPGRKPTR